MSHQIDISIVIATCNRDKVLGDCLGSIKNQTFPADRFEVIVVNDGSIDATKALLEQACRSFPLNFFVINQKNSGVSAARNNGLAKARGRLVAFTDDDCLVPPDWLEKIALEFENLASDIAGVGGPLDSFTDSDDKLIGRYVKYLDEFNHIPVLMRLLVRPMHVSHLAGNEVVPYLRTSNAAFRREALLKIGGFDPAFRRPGGEDPDLCYRLMSLGYRFKCIPELVVQHHTRDSFSAYYSSLGNYIEGEFKKANKKSLYLNKAIKRTYSYLVVQKLLALVVAVLGYPFCVISALRRGLSAGDSFLLPLLVVFTKIYAVKKAACCCLNRLTKMFAIF